MAPQAWTDYGSLNYCTTPQKRMWVRPMTEHSDIRASADSDVLPTNVVISCGTESVEKRKFSDLKTEVECDHLVYMSEGHPARMHARLRLTFCPKCGVKL
jgi:hypothetical protein